MFKKNKKRKITSEEYEFVIRLIKDKSISSMLYKSNNPHFYRDRKKTIEVRRYFEDACYVTTSINELEKEGKVLIFVNGEKCYETKKVF